MSISIPIKVPLSIETNPVSSQFLEYLADKSCNKNSDHMPVIYRNLPEVQSITEPCIFGVFSRSLINSRQQYMGIRDTINTNNGLSTITEVSRYYLDYYHSKRLRAFGAQTREIEYLSRHPPLYVKRTTMQTGTYVDIKSCYFSTLINLGWNVDYYPGKWLIAGRAPLDFPLKGNKPARSYLVTGCTRASCGIWTTKQIIYREIKNVHLNYALYGLVMSILHAIAQFAVVECEASYVHTDGYIVPSKHAVKLMDYISLWGYSASVKYEGATMVCGFSNFMVGDHRSKGFNPAVTTQQHDSIAWNVDTWWLLSKVSIQMRNNTARELYMKTNK